MESRLGYITGETVTFATGDLVRAFNAPVGASALEIRGTSTTTSFNFCPRLKGAWREQGGTFTDAVETLANRGDTTTITLNSFGQAIDFLYFGCDVPFRGIYINIVNANGNTADIEVTYWNGTAWTVNTIIDGTASGGATFAIDNDIAWTPPSDWSTNSVNGGPRRYWVRIAFTADLDSAVSIAEAIPMPVQPSGTTANSAANIRVTTTTAVETPRYEFNPEAVGGVEVTAANTNPIRMEWLGAPVSTVVVQ